MCEDRIDYLHEALLDEWARELLASARCLVLSGHAADLAGGIDLLRRRALEMIPRQSPLDLAGS